jgi:hypothetical protein
MVVLCGARSYVQYPGELPGKCSFYRAGVTLLLHISRSVSREHHASKDTHGRSHRGLEYWQNGIKNLTVSKIDPFI